MAEQIRKEKVKKARTVEEIADDVIPEQDEAKEKLADADKLLDDIDAILDVPEPVLKNKQGGPLTLADLMREGCEISQPLIGSWINADKACAFGAAELAAKERGLV